ncbi:hypothetical protein [Microbulbifer sp.]|uniref:hypothetical protein n=1 Tax=Microbulbifer sp. TaxID=1908541 RepID=UPI003F309C90
MQFLRYFISPILLGVLAGNTQAQSTNSDPCRDGSDSMPLPEKAIGVCNLDTNSHTFPNEGNKTIPFSIRSCWADWTGNEWSVAYCEHPRDYTIEVGGPTQGGQFVLSGPGGNIPFALTFSQPSSGSETLTPHTETNNRFAGSINGAQIPVEFEISLLGSTSFSPGIYSGNFEFYLYQCDPWWSGGICKGTTASQAAELSPPIFFTIEITVLPQIRISSLQDMTLTANPGGNTEDQQSFCVYTTGGISFDLRAESQNGNGAFILIGNAGIDSVDYQLRVESQTPPRRPTWLNEGVSTTNGRWNGHQQDGCNSGDNMLLTIRIPQGELANAQDSTYTDTLTLTVELE